MRRSILPTLSLAVLLAVGSEAGAQTTIDFEGLPASTYLPSSFAGLTWNNFYIGDETRFDPIYAYSRAAQSGRMFVLNGGGSPASISSASLFSFNGAYFGVGHQEDLFLTLVGYRGATEVYREVLALSVAQHQLFTVDFMDVDRVTFAAHRSNGSPYIFTMDDARFDHPASPTSVVPEPITMVLLGSGLVGIGGAARRRRKSVIEG